MVGAGWFITSNRKLHCHCEEVRTTLKTLAYDCGNPVIICLRANARSAFLFTGSPRSFHSLAMTKGTKCPIPHYLTTPALRATPPMEGNSARDGNVTSSSSSGGGADAVGGVVCFQKIRQRMIYHPKPWRRVKLKSRVNKTGLSPRFLLQLSTTMFVF